MSWFRRFRRRRLLASRMTASWKQILDRNAPFRSRLLAEDRARLDRSIQIMVAEKNWEGCAGLSLTDEHRVTVSAHAARLTLGFKEDYFDEVQSVLVYPTAYEAPSREHLGAGVVLEGRSDRLGEAWYRGPVILAWSDVMMMSTRTEHHLDEIVGNVVLHEFAHHLDMRNGRSADGIPVIESAADAAAWVRIVDRDYDQLCEDCRRGSHHVLDCYGTTNKAEFFAVATEAFFESPARLAKHWPDLFDLLSRFYRQQPA